jgi:DNA polymerase III epsilon subunit-like protein
MNLNNNILAAVDVETTGVEFGWHEILQVAILPLDTNCEPDRDLGFFYMNVAPKHPSRQGLDARNKHGLDAAKMAEECVSQEEAAGMLDDWFVKLNLPLGKRLVPLAHNWAFERGFLTHWLGIELFDSIWQCHPRDTMGFGTMINDVYAWRGEPVPFHTLSLLSMCNRCGVVLDNAHDALADCLATADLYKTIISNFG